MDLHWRVKQMREWIELGRRENLSYRELSRRSGLGTKTFWRWSRRFREEPVQEPVAKADPPIGSPAEPPADQPVARAAARRPRRAFVELVESASPQGGQIQIVLRGDRRVVVDGIVDVEALARVIAAVEQC